MHAPATLSLIRAQDYRPEPAGRLTLDNDQDALQADLAGVSVVELQFPAHTDGRAYSQARLLRHRRGFTGTIRATGEVLIDQLLQMQRCGFDQAVLRADQDSAHGTRLLAQFTHGYYQGDVLHPQPRFSGEGHESAALPVTQVKKRKNEKKNKKKTG